MRNSIEIRSPSHFCGLLLVRLSGSFVEFLVLDHKKFGKSWVKFPGGVSKDGETPFVDMVETLRREVREELGDSRFPENDQINILLPDEWLSERIVMEVPCESDNNRSHRKYFFLVTIEEISGVIRQREINDGDELLSVPRWVRAEDLYDSIFGSHFSPFVKGLKWVCDIFEASTDHYSHIFHNKRVMEIISRPK